MIRKWKNGHIRFLADIIIYQAEALQIQCTSTAGTMLIIRGNLVVEIARSPKPEIDL